jgi:hypothetical protein
MYLWRYITLSPYLQVKFMDKQLIQETIAMLQAKISPDAAIEIDLELEICTELIHLLKAYDVEFERQRVLLACYMLLELAKRKHCKFADDNHTLTKQILDGDYLNSMYYDFALHHQEVELVAYLAPVNKQIHIRMAEGQTTDRMLYNRFCNFISRNYRQVSGL